MFSGAEQGAQRDAAADRQASGGTDAVVIADDDVFGYGTLLAERRAIAAPPRLQHHSSRGGEWAKVFSPKHCRIYYVNTRTGHRSWDAPGGQSFSRTPRTHTPRTGTGRARRQAPLEMERREREPASHGRAHTRPNTGAKCKYPDGGDVLVGCLAAVVVIGLVGGTIYAEVKKHEKATCERKALCSWTTFYATPECAWSNATDSCTNQEYVNIDYDAGGSATKMCKWGQDAMSETCCKRCGDDPPEYECGCVTKETARKDTNKKNLWKRAFKTSAIAIAAVSLPCSLFLLLKYSRNWENTPAQKCCRPLCRRSAQSDDRCERLACPAGLFAAAITVLLITFTSSSLKEEHGYYNGCPGAVDDVYDILQGCPDGRE